MEEKELTEKWKEIIETAKNDDPQYSYELFVGLSEEAKKNLIDIIRTYQNPYPKDIFLWDNTNKIDFSRGRFNKHCYKIVESMRSDLLKEMEEKRYLDDKEEHDTCECGGTLIDIGRDEKDVLMFKCEKCGKEYYNERDL